MQHAIARVTLIGVSSEKDRPGSSLLNSGGQVFCVSVMGGAISCLRPELGPVLHDALGSPFVASVSVVLREDQIALLFA